MALSTYQLKPKFQQLLQPCLHALQQRQITPNQLTLLTLLLSCMMGALLAWQSQHLWVWALLPLFLFIRMALNALDGMLAKSTHQVTPFGQLLNELSDVASDAALYLPFAYLPFISAELLILCVFVAFGCEFAGVCAVLLGSPRRFDGPMGKSDRALAFGLFALAVALGWQTALWFNLALGGLLILLSWTLYNRCRAALVAA